MNVERLQLMSTLLGEIRDDKNRNTIFTLVGWHSKSDCIDDAIYELSDLVEDTFRYSKDVMTKSNGGFLPENFCGTTACAVGHACLDKRFNKLGLTLEVDYPVYDGESSWDAVNKFFDITEIESEWLFFDAKYPNREETTIDEVIDRINTFIKAGGIQSSAE